MTIERQRRLLGRPVHVLLGMAELEVPTLGEALSIAAILAQVGEPVVIQLRRSDVLDDGPATCHKDALRK